MPELPEVQTVVNDLNTAGLIGQTIIEVQVHWPRIIDQFSPEKFSRQIKGRKISAIRRRGKYIVFDFMGDGHLLVHLRMSGRLHLVSVDMERSKHEHAQFTLSDGRQLRFYDPRKFGRLYRVDHTATIFKRLGPEPLEKGFTAKILEKRLHSHKRLLKPLLLDQSFIAGLGNIYVDEALWDAGIHSCRISSSLSGAEVKALHRAIRKVLRRGLKNQGTTLGSGQANFYSVGRRRGRNRDQLKVFRRTDLLCPRCKTPIQRIIVGQRSTHICSTCQQL